MKNKYMIAIALATIACGALLWGCGDKNDNGGGDGGDDAQPKISLEYTLSEDGNSYTVAGRGNVTGGELVIPSEYDGKPVTAIGANAFESDSSLTDVTLPDGLISIGSFAFGGCNGLTMLTLPNGVTTIGAYAFSECVNLTSIDLPSSITDIGVDAFALCDKIEVAFIPTIALRYVPQDSIVSLCIDGGDTLAHDAINGDSLEKVILSDSVTTVEYGAFSHCYNLEYVRIEGEVTEIASSTFDTCPKLNELVISDSITSIGSYAFYNCGDLETIELSNVTAVGKEAFRGCDTLRSVTAPNLTRIGERAFNECPVLCEFDFSSVTEIADNAFAGCEGLTEVTLPDTVETIDGSPFSGCKALTVYCEAAERPETWDERWNPECPVVWDCKNNNVADDGYAYTVVNGVRYGLKDGVATVVRQSRSTEGNVKVESAVSYDNNTYTVTAIAKDAFYTCTLITGVELPSSVTEIGSWAFAKCWGLTSFVIPDGVTAIEGRTFMSCNLKSITIPVSVVKLGGSIFEANGYLTAVNYGGTKAQWEDIEKDSLWNVYTNEFTVKCTDGNITVKAPY